MPLNTGMAAHPEEEDLSPEEAARKAARREYNRMYYSQPYWVDYMEQYRKDYYHRPDVQERRRRQARQRYAERKAASQNV